MSKETPFGIPSDNIRKPQYYYTSVFIVFIVLGFFLLGPMTVCTGATSAGSAGRRYPFLFVAYLVDYSSRYHSDYGEYAHYYYYYIHRSHQSAFLLRGNFMLSFPLLCNTIKVITAAQTAAKINTVHHHEPIR